MVGVLAVHVSADHATAGDLPGFPAMLRLRIVPVEVTSSSPLNLAYPGGTSHQDVLPTQSGDQRARRFEVQYQIIDLDSTDIEYPSSLSTTQFDIQATVRGGAVPLQFERARLTRGQTRLGGLGTAVFPVGATDTSGNPTGSLANATGLHMTFRSGVVPSSQNDRPANGTPSEAGILGVAPWSLAAHDQDQETFPGGWFGLYSFVVTAGSPTADSVVTLALAIYPNPSDGTIWTGFSQGDPIPIADSRVETATASFGISIPATPTAALLSLGGLIAGRRRRT
jgi:hypothetical protein